MIFVSLMAFPLVFQISVEKLRRAEKMAFFINLYNALTIHGNIEFVLTFPIRPYPSCQALQLTSRPVDWEFRRTPLLVHSSSVTHRIKSETMFSL